jgi:hypothetical protein
MRSLWTSSTISRSRTSLVGGQRGPDTEAANRFRARHEHGHNAVDRREYGDPIHESRRSTGGTRSMRLLMPADHRRRCECKPEPERPGDDAVGPGHGRNAGQHAHLNKNDPSDTRKDRECQDEARESPQAPHEALRRPSLAANSPPVCRAHPNNRTTPNGTPSGSSGASLN